jgi:phosphatidylglycerophosphate synthase
LEHRTIDAASGWHLTTAADEHDERQRSAAFRAVKQVVAVVVCDATTANLKIAALTVLDRMVVTAHRAGCAPIFVVGEETVPLKRADALGIRPTFVREMPAAAGAALIISAGALFEVDDLKRVIEADGHLFTRDNVELPVRMSVAQPQPVIAIGVAQAVSDAASAREAERKLWASLGSTADGVVDRFFNRPVGRVLSKVLIHTPLSPNVVSLASILIGVGSAPFFASGKFITGALLLQLCAIVDCVDGDLARALFKQSLLGKWLDIGGDQVVHFSVFAAIGVGVARTNPGVPAIALGGSAALGVVLCFPVIIRALRRPVEQRGPLLSKLLDSTANRDFSVLLLALAFLGRMELFLWMAGVGIHVFWMALLALDRRPAAA